MSNWFYYNEKGEKIAITGGQLKWLAKNGKISPETVVETENGKTAPARKVKGLVFITPEPSEESPPEAEQMVETGIYNLAQPPNPFSGTPPELGNLYVAPSVVKNPFTVPFATAPPIVENPFTAPIPSEKYADMPEAIHAETMNWFASIMMFVLVLVLCCITGWVIWWLWTVTTAPPKTAMTETSAITIGEYLPFGGCRSANIRERKPYLSIRFARQIVCKKIKIILAHLVIPILDYLAEKGRIQS